MRLLVTNASLRTFGHVIMEVRARYNHFVVDVLATCRDFV
jgi:hypothetical protein